MCLFRQSRDSIYCPSSGYDGIGTTGAIALTLDCFTSHTSFGLMTATAPLLCPVDGSSLNSCIVREIPRSLRL